MFWQWFLVTHILPQCIIVHFLGKHLLRVMSFLTRSLLYSVLDIAEKINTFLTGVKGYSIPVVNHVPPFSLKQFQSFFHVNMQCFVTQLFTQICP